MLLQSTTLVFHLLGFGLLFTTLVAGLLIDIQYRKATELDTKATLLRAMRPIGLLSPFALILMLLTGIGNMHSIGFGLFDASWLTAKVIFFAIAAVNGIIASVRARKRGALVQRMIKGDAPTGSDLQLKAMDGQQRLFYLVNFILLIIILCLSVFKPM